MVLLVQKTAILGRKKDCTFLWNLGVIHKWIPGYLLNRAHRVLSENDLVLGNDLHTEGKL